MNKDESLRRMGQTDRNMERVADLMANLEEQMEPLREKAAKTQAHAELSQKKRLYDGALAFHDYKVADRLFTKQENEKIALQQEEIEINTELAGLGAREQQLKLKSEEQQQALRQQEELYAKAQKEEARLEGEKNVLAEQLRNADKELQELRDRIHEIEATIAGDKQKVLVHQKLLADGAGELTAKEAALQTAEQAYEAARQELQRIQGEFQTAQKAVAARHDEQLQLVGQVEKFRVELQTLNGELTKTGELVTTLTEELQTVGAEEAEALTKQQTLQEQQEANRAERDQEQQTLGELRKLRQQLERDVQTGRREEQRMEGRLQLLAQWAEQHEGYADGTRNALAAKEPWQQDLLGAIGDLFTVKPEFATALDIALGGSINHVVSRTSRAVR